MRNTLQNRTVPPLREALEVRLLEIDDLDVSASAFQSGDAYWVNGKEVLHFDAEDVIDLRLTQAEIRGRRPALRSDPRVNLRRSSSADWLEVRFAEPDDVDFVIELVKAAAAAHRPAHGQPSKPPPSGPDLERRRRFH